MLLQLIRAIRPINLLVITLTFYVLYQLDVNSREFIPKYFLYSLISLKYLTISTVLIAATGYLINDFYDKEVDAINKPTKHNLSKKTLLTVYTLLNIIALILSFAFASPSGLFWVFPSSIFLLWIYSYKLKGLPFIGNLCVALLSATIPFIYLFVQKSIYLDCQDSYAYIASVDLTLVFALLAFFSTLAREVAKDTEDIDGDKTQGLKTIPIVLGITTAKVVTLLFISITLVTLVFVIKDYIYFNFHALPLIALAIFGFIPLLIAAFKMYQGSSKKHFKQVGNLIKIAMFGFLVFIYLHAITLQYAI